MKSINQLYLPSGRIFLTELHDGYVVESTEMRDVSAKGLNDEAAFNVRNTSDPRLIWKHLVDYEEKWLLTISTQRGCGYKCKFCDVARMKYKGNLSIEEMVSQVTRLLINTPYVVETKKAKIGFARMGEPANNIYNVIDVIKQLGAISNSLDRRFTWLPCFNSILPRKTEQNLTGFDVIDRVIDLKENDYKGFLHFQISCNSTDEQQRKYLFGGADVLKIEEIVSYINKKDISNRTVTLNFIVMEGIEVDVMKLKNIGIDSNKFTVKLIPLNKTNNSNQNFLEPYANYSSYEKLKALSNKFNEIGVSTVVDSIAKCEEAGLCCGQLAQIFL